jgi:chorismate mutase/prephenate dehydratase
MDNDKRLSEIRDHIDQLDAQLQDLISQRATFAVEVGEIKKQSAGNVVFYRPEREAQILQKISARNNGPLSAEQITLIFRDILTACLSLQQPIKVAALGPDGTFSQVAALKHFGNAATINLTVTLQEVFAAVETLKADYGVVPYVNSTTGVINSVLDNLRTSSLSVYGEVLLPVHHCLLSTGNSVQEIQKIYAHEQALQQCGHWLTKHCPNVNCILVNSNGEAARLAAIEKNSAAIAGEFAAPQYQLNILEKNIEDNPQNITRFLILGRQKVAPDDKTRNP